MLGWSAGVLAPAPLAAAAAAHYLAACAPGPLRVSCKLCVLLYYCTRKLKYKHNGAPRTNGIWDGAVGITGKIAVTAASGMSDLSVLVQ